MVEHVRIDMSKETDVNKTTNMHECNIYHYRYFLKINFRFQQKICNGCHYLTQEAMSFNDVCNSFSKGMII